MIYVEFSYTGKSAVKTFKAGASIKGCNLGELKPTYAAILGDDVAIDKDKLKKWVAAVLKALDKDGGHEISNSVKEQLNKKEKKVEASGESKKDNKPIQE